MWAPVQAATGLFTYTLEKTASPTADDLDAYARIGKAMDSAVGYYNTYTTIRKVLKVQYAADVPTADGSGTGAIRFGSNRSYMSVITAMHEIAHTLGVGTTAEYAALLKSGVVEGPKATAALRQISGDPSAILKGDAQHIWPYGLNYASEVKSTADLVSHCKILEGLYQDMFHESLAFEGRIRNVATGTCMVRSGSALALGACTDSGARIRVVAIGDSAPVYRLEFGDKVLDAPNQSSTAGLALGLYAWNRGTNQEVRIEDAATPAAGAKLRLRMVHSALALRSSGAAIVQDVVTAAIDSRTWELLSDATSVTVRRNVRSIAATERADALGRRVAPLGLAGSARTWSAPKP